ncbi:MAG: hypothetical protein LBJ01_03615 [Tannerella sp.]|jgi:hypothetical protein|nr:hypothetical protein [Tannerella sp.]
MWTVVMMTGFRLAFRFLLIGRKQIAVIHKAPVIAGQTGMMTVRMFAAAVVPVFATLRCKANRRLIMVMMGEVAHNEQ